VADRAATSLDLARSGPTCGAWEGLVPTEVKEVMIRNAPTFLDELRDPTQVTIDEDSLTRVEIPVRLTLGSGSPPLFPRVIDRLERLIPHAGREVIEGAAHAPHLTTARAYVELTKQALQPLS